jgi:hypothetical protein
MAYGLQIKNPDEDILFDSNEVGRGTVTVSKGYIAFNTGLTVKAGQLVLFNIGTLPLGSKIEISATKTWLYGDVFSISFFPVNSGGSPGVTGVNYAVLEDMATLPKSGNFGLVCKTGAYVTSFDSRMFQTTDEGEVYIDKYQSYMYPLGHGIYITAPYSAEEWISAAQLEFTSVTGYTRTFSILFSNSGSPGTQIFYGGSSFVGHIYEHSSGSGSYNVSYIGGYSGRTYTQSLAPYVVGKTHLGVE